MQINGSAGRGHVLLIAGDSAIQRRRTQLSPSTNLAAMITVDARTLVGRDVPTDVVHLEGVRDPQVLRARLQTAAATTGPLLIYLSGRLTTDRRARQLHLALASTSPLTTRYTAFPWDWLRTGLRDRAPGSTTLYLDAVADRGAWERLRDGEAERLAAGLDLYGVIAPPHLQPLALGGRPSPYTRGLIEQMRAARPDAAVLHTTARASAELPPETLTLPLPPQQPPLPARPAVEPEKPPAGPEPGPQSVREHQLLATHAGDSSAGNITTTAQDPRPYIWQTAQAGDHQRAAEMASAWEAHVLRTHGPDSPQAAQWAEIRADLARIAGNWLAATQLWVAAGRARLSHQAPDAAEVLAAARSAHYCWIRVREQRAARESGPELIALLRALPALDPRHLSTAQQRLEQVQSW